MHTCPYQNNRIITVIRDIFFVGGATSFAQCFQYLFPTYEISHGQEVYEVPIAMVALIATAVGLFFGLFIVLTHHTSCTVMFGLNVRLDLSGKATTKSLCTLCTKPLLKILSKGTRTVAVRVIRGDGGVGDIPGVRGVSGESLRGSAQVARLTQELRLKV